MRAVILTGPPGVGKTAVLTALSDLLHEDDVRHAAIEVEALRLAYPSLDRQTAFDHLAYVAESFRRAGYPLLLVADTIEDGAYLRRLRAAICAEETMLVRLAASPAVLRARLVSREPPEWVGLAELLAAAETLASSMSALPNVDLVLATDHTRPRDVAAIISDKLPQC